MAVEHLSTRTVDTSEPSPCDNFSCSAGPLLEKAASSDHRTKPRGGMGILPMNHPAKAGEARATSLRATGDKIDIFLAGIGGQGILLASEIIAAAGLSAGYDVKKSEVHGMSQRGGSVTSCVRLGKKVHSPLIELGKADVLISLHPEEGRRYKGFLRRGGFFLETPGDVVKKLKNPRALNIVAVGMLSAHLAIPEKTWMDAIAASVPEKYLEENKEAFFIGRSLQASGRAPARRKEIGGRKNDL